ncbi:hypothetical protein A2U01_0066512, partial [Trifolium medium]|nr:hypothetical protein [Trifolium medium]
MVFWNLRAAQGYWHVVPFSCQEAEFFSGRCASCRLIWRGAQKRIQIRLHNGNLGVAQGIWRGAPSSVFEEIKA